MKSSIFFLLCLFLFSCESSNNSVEEAQENSVDNPLEERTTYEADSTIKVVYQIDKERATKQGNYKEYDAATQALIVERVYDHDKIVGTERLYYPDGQVKSELNYKDGVHHGAFKDFYPNGQLKQQGEYLNGKMEGVLRSFYSDGTLKEEVQHLNGNTQGPFKEYHENGKLKAEGIFTTQFGEESLEQGLIKLYDETGNLNKKMICRKGQCCTVWTVEKGDRKPNNELCKAIIQEFESSAQQSETDTL